MLRCSSGLPCIWPSAPPAIPRSERRLQRTNVTQFDLIEIRAFRRRALMHFVVMPSSPVFLTIFYSIASPTSCCPFLSLTMLQPPLKKTRYPDAKILEVPSLLVSCNRMTSQPFTARVLSRVLMWPIPLTPFTTVVRTFNVSNVSSSSRNFALAALCFLRSDFLSARFPGRFFRANTLRFLLSSRVVSAQVLAFVLPTCWVRHSYHDSTSLSSTLLLTRVCPPSTPPLLASGPTFSAAAVSQLCYRSHGCRGKRFCFLGGHRRQSMLLAGLHCQHRRVLASIDVMKEHSFMRELYS